LTCRNRWVLQITLVLLDSNINSSYIQYHVREWLLYIQVLRNFGKRSSRVIVFASIVQVVIASMFTYTLIISSLISHVYIKYNALLVQRNYVWTIVTQKENKTRWVDFYFIEWYKESPQDVNLTLHEWTLFHVHVTSSRLFLACDIVFFFLRAIWFLFHNSQRNVRRNLRECVKRKMYLLLLFPIARSIRLS